MLSVRISSAVKPVFVCVCVCVCVCVMACTKSCTDSDCMYAGLNCVFEKERKRAKKEHNGFLKTIASCLLLN